MRNVSSVISPIGLCALIVVTTTFIYGFFVSDTLRGAPKIVVRSPTSAFVSPPIRLEGSVKDIREFYINDRKTHTEKDGTFSALLSPPVGYTIIELLARDAHDRETLTHIPLIVTPYEKEKGSNEKENNNKKGNKK